MPVISAPVVLNVAPIPVPSPVPGTPISTDIAVNIPVIVVSSAV